MSGSFTVKHTTNNADVSGSYGVGGFIGLMEVSEQQTVVSFEDCSNNGNITGDDQVGGFVGIIGNTYVNTTISNSINNGNVTVHASTKPLFWNQQCL